MSSIFLTAPEKYCYDEEFADDPASRPRRLARPRTSPFHGGNTGSNPVGDANFINHLRNRWFRRTTGYATVQLLNHSTMSVALLF